MENWRLLLPQERAREREERKKEQAGWFEMKARHAHGSAELCLLCPDAIARRRRVLCFTLLDHASRAQPAALQNNTSVYITGIPDDATVAEVVEVFSKCGLIRARAGALGDPGSWLLDLPLVEPCI